MGRQNLLQPLAAAGLFALFPVAAAGGGLALAPALGLAGVLLVRPKALTANIRHPSIFLFSFVIFSTWAIVSTTWLQAADHRQAWRLLGVFVTGSLFFVGVSADQRTQAVAWAAGVAAMIMLIVTLGFEWLDDMPFNRLAQPGAETWVLLRNPGRGATLLLTLLWPAVGGLVARGGEIRFGFAALATILVGVLADQFGMEANLVAFALGCIAFALAFAAPRLGLWVVSSALALWLLAAPFVLPMLAQYPGLVATLPLSWAARAEIWKFAGARIMEQPWIGRGLDASRHFNETIDVQGQQMRAIPLHPHSGSLQIWLELGLVGALLAAAVLVFGGAAMARAFSNNRAGAAAAAATLACFGFSANVSYGAWQEWWVATAFIGATLVATTPTSAKA